MALPREVIDAADRKSYTELLTLDAERASLINIARKNNSNLLDFLFLPLHFQGTVLPVLMMSPLNWVTLILYAFLWNMTAAKFFLEEDGVTSALPQFMSKHVGLIGGFASVLLVFFANGSYSRMETQYFVSMSAVRRILDVATVARTDLPRARALRVVRYMNGAHMIAYMGLSSTYGAKQVLTSVNKELKLFTESELEKMYSLGIEKGNANTTREVIAWALHLVNDLPADSFNKACQFQLISNIIGLRQDLGKLYEYSAFPVPFFYVHLVYFLSNLYLPLATLAIFNECAAKELKPLGFLLVLFNNIYVLGLRHVGRYFSDPYGDEAQDFRVLQFVTFALKASRQVLESSTVEKATLAVEQAMAAASFAKPQDAMAMRGRLSDGSCADGPIQIEMTGVKPKE